MMAGIQQIFRSTKQTIFNEIRRNVSSHHIKPKKLKQKRPEKVKQIQSVAISLAHKGFLRSTKSFVPPENVSMKIEAVCKDLNLPIKSNYKFANLEEKFNIFQACFVAFKHGVPNSQIYELNSIKDLIEFYETPVDTRTPYETLKDAKLPENLHIQHDYLRFDPATDTKFNGHTAFPKSSTIVTGLKYRDKYPGHDAKRSWP